MSEANNKLQQAEAKIAALAIEVAAAGRRTADLKAMLANHEAELQEFLRQLSLAREARDGLLPQVRMVTRCRYGSSSEKMVVVVKRTPKTITIRHIGGPDAVTKQYRPSKYQPGVWEEHPRGASYLSTRTELEILGDAEGGGNAD